MRLYEIRNIDTNEIIAINCHEKQAEEQIAILNCGTETRPYQMVLQKERGQHEQH